MRASIASFIPWFQDVLYPELLHKRLLALYGDLGSLVPSATFFSAASMPQSFLVLDSRRIIPETHRPLMTIGSIPGMGVFDIKEVGL